MIDNPSLPDSLTSVGGVGFADSLVTSLIAVGFVAGAAIFLFMMLYGGIQWITSGGNKGKIDTARTRITHAFSGIVVLFSFYVVINVAGCFLGVGLGRFQINELYIGFSGTPWCPVNGGGPPPPHTPTPPAGGGGTATPPGNFTPTPDLDHIVSGVVRAFISSSWVPVFDADVFLTTPGGGTVIRTTTSDGNGIYAFLDVPDGQYEVHGCKVIEGETHYGSRTNVSPPNQFADIFMLPQPSGCPYP